MGPRMARIHVGGGRAGFSSGAGPVSFYTSIGGRRRSSVTRRAPHRGGGYGGGTSAAAFQRQVAAQQRQLAQVQREQEANLLGQAFIRILGLHRAEFPPAARPLAPAPQPPDRASIYRHYEQYALAGIGILNLSGRADAKRQAAAWTEAEVQRLWSEASAQQAQYQQYLDQRWRQLCANQPEVVMATLEEAFEDNEAPAAPVNVVGAEVSLALLVPTMEEAVPERVPTTTAAGNLSLKKLSQRDRMEYYKQFVCGQLLVTVKEAFATAPNLVSTRIVVLRNEGRDSYGHPRVTCIMAALVDRYALRGVHWHTADAAQVVGDAASELIRNEKGQSRSLYPIDLSQQPAIARFIEAVDLTDLAAGGA